MVDPEYKESPEYLRECIAELQAKLDDPRGNICELCDQYEFAKDDCKECRWNYQDKFQPIKEGR